MSSDLRISIAMATYNGATFLREQLNSLAAQTHLPDEIVATDDGSTDSTLEVLADFAEAAPFSVRVERNPKNLGYARNFEKAARLCTGDVVFFCDQDDIWYPQKIATVIRNFDRETMVVINDADLVHGDLTPFGRTQYQALRSAGFHGFDFDVGCFSAHRKAWQQVAFPVPEFVNAHDHWTNRLAHEAGVAKIIEEPLQLYRRHGANASQWSISNADSSNINIIREHRLDKCTERWRFLGAILQLMQERLNERRELLPPGVLKYGVKRLDHRQSVIEERATICELSRVHRWTSVIRFWVNGGYRYNRGLISAIKDIIRP